MPGSGSAAQKATRNNLSEKQRHRLVEHLLKGSKNGKLVRGDLKKAAARKSRRSLQQLSSGHPLRVSLFGCLSADAPRVGASVFRLDCFE